ncbi:MAG: glycosyltransferase [Ignavibacteriales bacterium]|nr:glycosyltransferase [Ignavibacteriales bacterium]
MKFTNSNIILSVIIPARNEVLYLRKAIDSIMSNGFDIAKLVIIIVDAMSNDKMKQIVNELVEQYVNIKYFENKKIFTPYGLNIGIENAIGKYIMLFVLIQILRKITLI